MSSPVPRVSLPDHVFARLREEILTGNYRAGERLPPQRALAAEFGVNMASIREALKRLEQLRLVEVRHGDGTLVLDWRRSGGLEALMLADGLGESVARDLFEARTLLLVEAARLAAERRESRQADELTVLARAVGGAADAEQALMADWAFMAALVEAAGNLLFQLIMNSVRELYLPQAANFAALVGERAELGPLYERVADAVAHQAGEQAAGAMRELAGAQGARVLP
jgi:GntR family transcriptional repressor for pyruvate dehydrogenase complex